MEKLVISYKIVVEFGIDFSIIRHCAL